LGFGVYRVNINRQLLCGDAAIAHQVVFG
jgi:hypothetical protein